MSLALYAYTCGFLTIPHGFLLEGADGWITVPIPSYLIVHPAGKALFDSGLNVRTQTDPEPYIGRAGMRYATFHFHPGEEISARLAAMAVAPEEITCIVNSHLHYDHCGGNAQLPNADVVVQRREWRHAMALPDDDPGYRKVDFDTGQRTREIEGEHDLFGDGSVVCLPTYGHTPGTSRCACARRTASSCSAGTPATSGSRSNGFTRPASSPTGRRPWLCCGGFARCRGAASASCSVTTRNSGRACRRAQSGSADGGARHAEHGTLGAADERGVPRRGPGPRPARGTHDSRGRDICPIQTRRTW